MDIKTCVQEAVSRHCAHLRMAALPLLFSMAVTASGQDIPAYPIGGEGLAEHSDFGVWVDGCKAPTYKCTVNPNRRNQTASWCQFGIRDAAKVRVICRRGKIDSAVVRPLSKKVRCEQLNDSTLQFEVPSVVEGQSYSLSVEVNGDREHNLHLFVENIDTDVPAEPSSDSKDTILWNAKNAHDVFVQNARLIYFGPGIHKPKDLPSGEIKIPSNCTVYMAPGAIVRARLIVDHAENVRIIGRGVLLNPLRGVEITYSKNVTIDGLTVINPLHYTVYGGQSDSIMIRNLRSFSSRPWSDGIDLMCCSNVTVEDVFLRNNDDAIALYNHRWWYWGGSENFLIRRATIFSDLAHPINIGTHGDDRAERGEVLCNVRMEDCDILSADGGGIFRINTGDQNVVRDVWFNDIRIEDVVKSRLFNITPVFSDKYNRCPGGSISNVWFSNISYVGDESKMEESVIKNYDESRTVSGVHFKNITINGKKVRMKDIE